MKFKGKRLNTELRIIRRRNNRIHQKRLHSVFGNGQFPIGALIEILGARMFGLPLS